MRSVNFNKSLIKMSFNLRVFKFDSTNYYEVRTAYYKDKRVSDEDPNNLLSWSATPYPIGGEGEESILQDLERCREAMKKKTILLSKDAEKLLGFKPPLTQV